jgi:putative ABC transport system ATP-binding protein
VTMALLTGRGLRKNFGPTEALRGVDIDIGAGEVIAILGPSGSGKSTLLHCLAGILAPDAGEVTFEGTRIDKLNDRHRSRLRRSAFGFVFQFGQLVPELPIIENIALPLPGEVAGGQSQRAAIARALIAGPRLVFADEPTGSLDSVSADQVMELLVDVARAEDAGVVIVTHEARVAAYADRRITVRDGFIKLRSEVPAT